MCVGYSLDETHTPEIVACLIPASLRSPVITFTNVRVLSLSRAASLESDTNNASLISKLGETKGLVTVRTNKNNYDTIYYVISNITDLFLFRVYAVHFKSNTAKK